MGVFCSICRLKWLIPPVEIHNFLIGYPLPRRKCLGALALSKTKHTGLLSLDNSYIDAHSLQGALYQGGNSLMPLPFQKQSIGLQAFWQATLCYLSSIYPSTSTGDILMANVVREKQSMPWNLINNFPTSAALVGYVDFNSHPSRHC